jgi:hypothetical protein
VYQWRQHDANGTRWQGRCGLDAFRHCKVSVDRLPRTCPAVLIGCETAIPCHPVY